MITRAQIIAIISKWWSDTTLKTRLLALTTLIVSLIMSSLTFGALTTIQEDAMITDNRFCKDLGILFASNVLDFVEADNQKELSSFVEKIYLSTSSIRYVLFFHVDGSLFFGLPVYNSKVQKLLHLHRNLLQLETQEFFFGTPLIQYNSIFNDNIIDIIIPLTKNGKNLGSLDLGINSNPTLSSSSKLIRDISMAIFVSIWFMVIIGAGFNTLTITEPITELLLGVKSIASGNFSQRIKLPFDGELGDLIFSFNEMAERLESYEKKNVDKIMLEKMKLETIVSTIADGAILVDTDLRVLFVNQIAVKAFQWSTLDIVGQPVLNYFPSHIHKVLLPILKKLLKSTYIYNSNCRTEELCINFDNKSTKTIRFLLTTVLNHNSNLLSGVAIITQDISREVKLNEAKNQFIANVSHELRTPLCNIGSFLETLLDYHTSLTSQQQIQFLNIANNETKRLTILVNDILDLSRLESEYNYNLNPVMLSDILQDLVKTSQIVADCNSVKLILEIDPSIKLVWANENALWQVLANLLSNAIKFTSIYGQIVLRVYIIDSCFNYTDKLVSNQSCRQLVRIEIIDEGIGIEPRDQKRIFDRFVRIENNIHILEGTGLGLSIVQSIVNQHNTEIALQSQLYVGTSFWFDLLRAD